MILELLEEYLWYDYGTPAPTDCQYLWKFFECISLALFFHFFSFFKILHFMTSTFQNTFIEPFKLFERMIQQMEKCPFLAFIETLQFTFGLMRVVDKWNYIWRGTAGGILSDILFYWSCIDLLR